MTHAVTDFLKDASLLGLLNILIAAIFLAAGLASFLSRRPRNKYQVLAQVSR